jgi:hypothetical protein
MDRRLQLLKRKALQSGTDEDWQFYIKALERCAGDLDIAEGDLYLAHVLPGIPGAHGYITEETHNPNWWGVFETEREAFSFALSCVESFLLPDAQDGEEEWIAGVTAVRQMLDSGEYDYDIGELVQFVNYNEQLREGQYLGGGQTVYLPMIFIVPI